LKSTDTNVITGLLKLYLRELPEALFTDALYPKLVEGMGMYIRPTYY
jgi:RhoGAP domain